MKKACLGVGSLLSIAALAAPVSAANLVVSSLFEPTFDDGRVETLKTDGSGRKVLRHLGSGLRGVVVDVTGGSMYWSDVNSGRIERVPLRNTWAAPEGIFSSGLSFIQDLEFSSATQQLFWVDAIQNQVAASSLDGGNVEVLFSAFSTTIGVDATNGKIYSEDREDSSRGSIVRADFDGSDYEVVISGVPTAADIAIDPVREYIYWTSSAGLSNGNGGVYRVNFDGTGFSEIFVMGSNLDATGIAVDVATGDVYWAQSTDTNRSDIYRMNVYSCCPEIVSRGYGNVSDMSLVSDFTAGPTIVDIDIKPGDDSNIVNLRSRSIWVAVLSDAEEAFDPLQIDLTTVRFGPAETGVTRYVVRDINSDGIADLLLRFDTAESGLATGDTKATVTAKTFHGEFIAGTDAIRIVGTQPRQSAD